VDHLDERWLNQTGQNIIRVVIGSYFTAVSLDLVNGVDQRALFATLMTPESADLVGSTLLLGLSVAFMIGVSLRLTGLMLALFVFSSSLLQNFLHFESGNLSHFWRDLALICGVLLNYSWLRSDELEGAAIVTRRVKPRRVATDRVTRHRLSRDIRAALEAAPVRPIGPVQRSAALDEEENIFA